MATRIARQFEREVNEKLSVPKSGNYVKKKEFVSESELFNALVAKRLKAVKNLTRFLSRI